MSEEKPQEEKKKNLFWVARVNNAIPNWRQFMKQERQQYRTDVKALLCRGAMEEEQIDRIKMSLNVEWAIFGMSRALVPLCLFVMYRRGVFQESFQLEELKSIFKIGVAMHAMDLSGHMLMRQLTHSIVDEHIGVNEESFAFKKKTVDDYLVQKNYFKTKKDNKL